MSSIDFFSTNIGVSGVLPPLEDAHLPDAADINQHLVYETGLDALFAAPNLDSNFLNVVAYEPSSENKSLTMPGALTAALSELKEDLKSERDPSCRMLLRDVIDPLLEDQMVLQEYQMVNSHA